MFLDQIKKVLIILLICSVSCTQQQLQDSTDWCTQIDLDMYKGLEEIHVDSEWFKVFAVGEAVYAIAEPYNYQEVISYLIIGSEKALLFDTGNGFASIASVVNQLTSLPITVINSHTHYDHIGGNYEFDTILAFETPYTLHWATEGWTHDLLKDEVSPAAFCHHRLPGLDTTAHHVKPFQISAFVQDGDLIELGDRSIQVIAVPGHTPDAMALLDEANGYLWTGDTFYEAPIWLYYEGTDLDAYEKSIQRLAALTRTVSKVFPAHNRPIAKPMRLIELVDAFDQILLGTKKESNATSADDLAVQYEFEHFSFLIRRDLLLAKRNKKLNTMK